VPTLRDRDQAGRAVPPGAYPSAVTRGIAALLTSGRELCFGAADAMPPELGAAFDHAVLWDLAQPSALSTAILPELAHVPATQHSSLTVCGKPEQAASQAGLRNARGEA
jgi:hypothetical protein